jgi:cysteine-rich repeat protein
MSATSHIRTTRFVIVLAIPVWLAAGCKIQPGEGQFICTPDVPGNCPPGWVCQMRGTSGEYRCYSSSGAFCGNGQLDPGEECDATEFSQGCENGHPICDECRLTCTECGNGITERAPGGIGEECDCGTDATGFPRGCVGPNGTELPGGCRLECTQARCGDDATDLWEQCDDGNTVSGDGCSSDCLSTEVCGNAFGDFALGELCDDGNVRSADGCSSQCQPELPVWGEWHSRFGRGRTGFAMAYNPDRGTAMMFGGWDGQEMLNELWEYDGLHWFKVDATAIPSVRMSHAMAYDTARGRLVLFGGFDGLSILEDTWEFDGSQWVETSPGAGPIKRQHAAMEYDAARGVVVLFGGTRDALPFGFPLNDTWEYDGTQWQDVSPVPSPAARYGAAMTYDATRFRMVLFGGRDQNGRMFDTWEYDGNQWQPVATAFSPSPRYMSAMTFDSSRNRVVLFGGGGGGDHYNDTWEYDGNDWLPVDLDPAERPPERLAARMVFDTHHGRSVLFGGEFHADILADTWEYNGVRWVATTPPMSPTQRWGQAMAYALPRDAGRRRVVLFGGHDLGTGTYRSDTWEFDGENWIEVLSTHDSSPPARAHAAMAYDPVRDRIVLFGGEDANHVLFSDTWEYDGETWTQVSPPGSVPGARAFHSMVYDTNASAVLLFGGRDLNGFLNDTWLYNGTTWTRDHPAQSPGERRSAPLVFDIARRRTVLFGGTALGPTRRLYDTWEYLYSGGQGQWMETTPAWVSPPPRTYHAMVYDASRGRTMLFGGAGDYIAALADAWEYDGYQWRPVFPITIPLGREAHTMVYDAARKRVVMFGGTPNYNETWEYAFRNVSVLENCENGEDDDTDTLVDCADPDCNFDPDCAKEICDNNDDDDQDGRTDCADPKCGGLPCGAYGRICIAKECRCPGSDEDSACDDHLDNDCDGAIDCNDEDCASSQCCSGGGLCQPLTCLKCGDYIFGTNVGAPSEMADYGCPVRSKSGSEVEYRFYSTAISNVTVKLTRMTADLDLIVLGTDGSGACDPAGQCVAGSQIWIDDEVTFTTAVDRTYFIVVDGYSGAEGAFMLQVECN